MLTLGSSSGHCSKIFLRIEFTDDYCVVVTDKYGPNLRSMMIFVHAEVVFIKLRHARLLIGSFLQNEDVQVKRE